MRAHELHCHALQTRLEADCNCSNDGASVRHQVGVEQCLADVLGQPIGLREHPVVQDDGTILIVLYGQRYELTIKHLGPAGRLLTEVFAEVLEREKNAKQNEGEDRGDN